MTVEFGYCTSGRNKNAGPFKCKVEVNICDANDPRYTGSAEFSLLEIYVYLHLGMSCEFWRLCRSQKSLSVFGLLLIKAN